MRHSLFLHVCMIDETRWCHRIYHLWSFSFHSRYPRSEAWIGGPLRQFIIRWLPVPYAYYTMIQWPVISFWSLIISHLYWFRSGWDNGSIERASQRWCVLLCTCLKSITHSNRRIATYGVALYSWLERMYVRYITDQSCLYMCIEFLLYEQGGALILWHITSHIHITWWIDIEIHMHRIHNYIYIITYIHIYIYLFIYLYLLLFLSICFVCCIC